MSEVFSGGDAPRYQRMTAISDATGTEKLMSGNEAIARGALEAGVCFCASYPGTPATEIAASLMEVAEQFGIYVEWSVNEKVALESCAGASWAGIPTICSMKSLGLNVAADFLLNVNLSGTGPGGLVIVVCDDPRGHSSSNEQDSRFYAKAAYIPLLEPSTCQQAKDIIPMALGISQRFHIPVMVRSTTRLSHSRSVVKFGEIPEKGCIPLRDIANSLYNVPNPHLRHKELYETLSQIRGEFDSSNLNGIPEKKTDTLIIASGVGFKYAEEAVNLLKTKDVQVTNLVTTHPLPQKTIMKLLQDRKKVVFAEEVDPFVEEAVLALVGEAEYAENIAFYGKRNGYIPFYGELDTDVIIDAIIRVEKIERLADETPSKRAVDTAKSVLIPRPLTFCAGCTHRNVYWALQRVRQRLKGNLIVAGDIGCYSLGVFYGESMETMQAMGSGIGTASGLGQLHRFGFEKKIVAVAGDSTFFHACLPGLVNAKHKNAEVTFLILDNSTTAMTGFQPHPGSKDQKQDDGKISIESVVKSISPDHFQIADASNTAELIDLLHKTIERRGLKVLLLDSVCRLEEARIGETYESLAEVRVDTDLCRGNSCRICTDQFGCNAITWDSFREKPEILEHICVRCGACIAVCPHDAIRQG
ncbi:MAG: thiamine pyrophosphate-dependent enzyme [Promethearchaeota archaeon]